MTQKWIPVTDDKIVISKYSLVFVDRLDDYLSVDYIGNDGVIGGFYDDAYGGYNVHCYPEEISATKDYPPDKGIILDGPVVWKTTSEISKRIYLWYSDGVLHRLDGPAIVFPDGRLTWWVDGKQIPVNTQEEFERWLKINHHTKELPRQNILNLETKAHLRREYDDGPFEDEDGTLWYYKNGHLHRDDGPAVIYPDGGRKWYKQDELHRDDGPAVEWPDSKRWWVNGKRHRLDGPAIENAGGHSEWWVDGKHVPVKSQKEFESWLKVHRIDKEQPRQDILNLEDINIPAPAEPEFIDRDPNKNGRYIEGDHVVWYKNGLYHRLDGPAVIGPDHEVYKVWYKDGRRHREDGPALVTDNCEKWYFNGLLHRDGGPAIFYYKTGTYAWYKNGFRHRLDGPASHWGKKSLGGEGNEWWVDGQNIPVKTQKEFKQWLEVYKKTKALPRQDILDLESFKDYATKMPVKTVNSYTGNTEWKVDGVLHRDDGPALIGRNGDQFWYQNGVIHRNKGPAAITKHGKIWAANGERHRLDGPAVEWTNGGTEWWVGNERIPVNSQEDFETWLELDAKSKELPRQDVLNLEKFKSFVEATKEKGTPDHISPNGIRTWKRKGMYHRLDGPAIQHKDGTEYWYVNGMHHRLDGPAIRLKMGDGLVDQWYVNNQRHRDGGPAIVWPDGSEEWYQNDLNHRIGGPAVTYVSTYGSKDGRKVWYVDGAIHRLDGPAVEWDNGVKSWYFNGELVPVNSQNEFEQWLKINKQAADLPRQDVLNLENADLEPYKHTDEEGITTWTVNGLLHRPDGPAVVRPDGSWEWYRYGKEHRVDGPAVQNKFGTFWVQNGKFHRLEGPAIKWKNGDYSWFKNGSLHRVGGPALFELSTGRKEWWVDGVRHRLDGPAVYSPLSGKHKWWVNGKEIPVHSQEEFKKYLALNKKTNTLPRQDVLDLESFKSVYSQRHNK